MARFQRIRVVCFNEALIGSMRNRRSISSGRAASHRTAHFDRWLRVHASWLLIKLPSPAVAFRCVEMPHQMKNIFIVTTERIAHVTLNPRTDYPPSEVLVRQVDSRPDDMVDHFVYGLTDPQGVWRYVGSCSDRDMWCNSHRHPSITDSSPLLRYMREQARFL